MKDQKIYGLICDCGDGSAIMRWFQTERVMLDKLTEEEYCQNEGYPSVILTFPPFLDLKVCGFKFHDGDG